MANKEIPQDLLKQISTALESEKVDPYMRHQFSSLKDREDFNPTVHRVGFLARVSSENTKVNYVLSKIGTVFGIYAPWVSMPDFVNNSEVISMEASR